MTLNQPPVTFDEVQRIPDLFRYIKIECDKRDEYGLYCLSGSQPFRLMQNVSESLSGRISIIELAGLSLREIQGDTFDQPFLPSMDYVMERQKTARQPENIWQIIHRGSFPELYQNPELDWQQFYASYIKTYLERDVRELSAVQNLDVFRRFMVAVAARTGQMVNYANIADEVGRDAATIRNWFSILEASGIIYLLEPYTPSVLKRAIKTPKVYFRDTGLASYLTRWLTPETLAYGAMAGNMFETFVISEILNLRALTYSDNSRIVCLITNAAITKVSASETGIEYRTPSSPKRIGSRRAKPTPNTTSLIIEMTVEASAFPRDCR